MHRTRGWCGPFPRWLVAGGDTHLTTDVTDSHVHEDGGLFYPLQVHVPVAWSSVGQQGHEVTASRGPHLLCPPLYSKVPRPQIQPTNPGLGPLPPMGPALPPPPPGSPLALHQPAGTSSWGWPLPHRPCPPPPDPQVPRLALVLSSALFLGVTSPAQAMSPSDPQSPRLALLLSSAPVSGARCRPAHTGTNSQGKQCLPCLGALSQCGGHRVHTCPPGIMLLKASVLWPMKSRPIGSWSQTRKRTSAISGMCTVNTRVSSQVGLNPGEAAPGGVSRGQGPAQHHSSLEPRPTPLPMPLPVPLPGLPT